MPAARFSLARDMWPLVVALFAVWIERFHAVPQAFVYALSVLAVWMAARAFGVLARAAAKVPAREEKDAARELVWIVLFGCVAIAAVLLAAEITLPRDMAQTLASAHFSLFVAPTVVLFGAALIIWVFSPSPDTAK